MVERPLLFICECLTNLGDLALLSQNLTWTRQQGRVAYVRGWQVLPAEVSRQVEELGGILVNGQNGIALARLATRCDIILGGGQIVRDNVSIRSLLSVTAAVAATRLTGGRVRTWGMGVSRIRSRSLQLLWSAVLKMTENVAVRDSTSETNAAKLVSPAHIRRTADMAFLPSPLHTRLRTRTMTADADIHLLVVPCIESTEGRSIDGVAFGTLLNAISDRLGRKHIVFACHDPVLDGPAVDFLIERYAPDRGHKSAGYQLSELCALYPRAALVVTNRLHAAIFALLANRPLLVVEDGTAKLADLCAMFDVPSVRVDRAEEVTRFDAAIAQAMSFDSARRMAACDQMARDASLNIAPEGITLPINLQVGSPIPPRNPNIVGSIPGR